jgi:pimeloyl-ACP methyl ester carboxylesterase
MHTPNDLKTHSQPSMSFSALVDCKYRLDNATSATLVLPDGRTLGYAEYGAPTGAPIFYMPGFPSSRIEGTGLDPKASRAGARIIALDRPVYGLSTRHPHRTHTAPCSVTHKTSLPSPTTSGSVGTASWASRGVAHTPSRAREHCRRTSCASSPWCAASELLTWATAA